MGELSQFMQMQGNYPTCITRFPSGRYGFVGSVPVALTKPYTSGFTKGRTSIALDTEQDCIFALLQLGYTKFQLADCSWYKA